MYDVTVIGCGIIGASIAYELSRYQLSVAVLEKENDVSMGTTRANSAIVHAGYDPKHGTLMARLNMHGAEAMEQLCEKLSVEYAKIGSLVLAFTAEDLETITELYKNGVENGVPGLKTLTREETLAMEPALSPKIMGALYAPSAAVVSPWGLCIAEAEVAVLNGVDIKLSSGVNKIEKADGFYRIHTEKGIVESRYIVNAAGVYADKIQDMAGEHEFTIVPNRGEYYLCDKNQGSLVSHVIFQCPTKEGKGVLVSPTVHGNLIVGPNAQDIAARDDVGTTTEGLELVSKRAVLSVPSVDFRQNIRNFAGIRAQSDRPDFIIEPSKTAERFLNVAGIKSPGLSAAPAIAEYALELLSEMGLALSKKDNFIDSRKKVHFKNLSAADKAELIRKNPKYGRVICRCETITEGEILDAIHSPIPPKTLDGIKRRCGTGMGRCQGGFCGPRVQEILARELNISEEDILMDKDGTKIILSKTKTGGARQ